MMRFAEKHHYVQRRQWSRQREEGSTLTLHCITGNEDTGDECEALHTLLDLSIQIIYPVQSQNSCADADEQCVLLNTIILCVPLIFRLYATANHYSCSFHLCLSRDLFILYIYAHILTENLVTWCKNNHLEFNINKLKEPEVDYNASNMNVATKKL